MAFITVGIDTSRTYNKKQPPGGACADLFGGSQINHPGDDKNVKKLNRMLSNVELSDDKPAMAENKVEKEVTQPRIQRKSQPSVCPVTGETIGHNLAAPEPTSKNEGKAEVIKPDVASANKKATAVAASSITDNSSPEPKAKCPSEPKSAPTINTLKVDASSPKNESVVPVAATTHTAPQSADSTPPPSTPIMKAPSPSPAPVHANSDPAPVMSSPVPAAAVANPNPIPVASNPAPAQAPVKTRRVPPGGHTTAFW